MTAARAALPMYDWPEVRDATDALWSGIARRLAAAGIEAPAALDRDRPEVEVWTDRELLLAQTCGLPYSTGMAGTAIYLATPHYDARGCAGADYCSLIVARHGENQDHAVARRGTRLACNGRNSLSGFLAFTDWLGARGHAPPAPEDWVETGSHRASLEAVAAGRADLAAIDAVAFALAVDHLPEVVAELRIVAESRRYPGLPYITAAANRSRLAAIRAVLAAAFGDPATQAARRALHITGLSVLSGRAYDEVRKSAKRLTALGWGSASRR